jgi:hypothetical protein
MPLLEYLSNVLWNEQEKEQILADLTIRNRRDRTKIIISKKKKKKIGGARKG